MMVSVRQVLTQFGRFLFVMVFPTLPCLPAPLFVAPPNGVDYPSNQSKRHDQQTDWSSCLWGASSAPYPCWSFSLWEERRGISWPVHCPYRILWFERDFQQVSGNLTFSVWLQHWPSPLHLSPLVASCTLSTLEWLAREKHIQESLGASLIHPSS